MKQLKLETEQYRYLEKAFGKWLETMGYATQSIYYLPLHLRELFYYLETDLEIKNIQKLRQQHILSYYEKLKQRKNQTHGASSIGNNYLNKHQQAIKRFLDYLRQTTRVAIAFPPLESEQPDTRPIEVLTVEEIAELFAATYINNQAAHLAHLLIRDRAMLVVFYCCGLRRNEVYHLNTKDIHYEREYLHVRKGKNNKERFVPLRKEHLKHLEVYQYDCRPRLQQTTKREAFFLNYRGERMGKQSFENRLKLTIQKTESAGIIEKHVGLHGLRHSIATHLLQNGMELEQIAQFLGHGSLESTQIYTHLVEKD